MIAVPFDSQAQKSALKQVTKPASPYDTSTTKSSQLPIRNFGQTSAGSGTFTPQTPYRPATTSTPPTRPATPGAPTVPPAAAGSSSAATAQSSPLDALYYANVAQNQFSTNNQINALTEKGAYGKTDLQNALTQLTHGKALAERNAMEAANSRGLIASSTLGNNLGEVDYGYGQRSQAAQTGYERLAAQIAEQVAALRGGENLYDQAQYQAAVLRKSAADAANKALGESPAPLTPPAGSPTPGAPAPGAQSPATPVTAPNGVQTTLGQLAQTMTQGREALANAYLVPPAPARTATVSVFGVPMSLPIRRGVPAPVDRVQSKAPERMVVKR